MERLRETMTEQFQPDNTTPVLTDGIYISPDIPTCALKDTHCGLVEPANSMAALPSDANDADDLDLECDRSNEPRFSAANPMDLTSFVSSHVDATLYENQGLTITPNNPQV